jgi:ankyrin repeat protein
MSDQTPPLQLSAREIDTFMESLRNGDRAAVLDFLEKYPTAIDARDKHSGTALIRAVHATSCEMVNLLLEKGAAVDASTPNFMTPLLWAAEDGNDGIIELLLKKGADINHRNDDGDTALMLAAANEATSTIKLLLKNGAIVSFKNNNNETALAIAQQMLDSSESADERKEDKKIMALLEGAERKQRSERTDFSQGLKKPIPRPRPIKIQRHPAP